MKENHPSAQQLVAPPNLIEVDCASITPKMLTLVELDQQQIDGIVQTVPGGARNVQDIYPLAPSQEGMLFHQLLHEQSDTYVLSIPLEVQSRVRLEALIGALQTVIDRHDVLRSAIVWEQLPRPVQVVYRQAHLRVENFSLNTERGESDPLTTWRTSQRTKWNLRQAPLVRLHVAADAAEARWYVVLELHHVVCDHGSLKIVFAEAMAYLEGRSRSLREPAPYRTHVAQALANAEMRDPEGFFRRKLAMIDEPTAPFGLLDVRGDGTQIEEARRLLNPALAHRVRTQARYLGVTAARLFHAAWALVVSRTSGRDDVIFGTVLLASRYRGALTQPMIGMFVNTLPLRLQVRDVTARELVEQTQRELGELLNYVDTPLLVAQRCSGIVGSAPLFSALLNYRYTVPNPQSEWSSSGGIRVLAPYQFRTNYPVTLTIDNLGEGFSLTAQTDRRINPHRITEYLQTALQSLVDALEQAPQTPALALSVLPESERHQVIELFNATQAPYSDEALIHELFQQQVRLTPEAVAVVYEGLGLTYSQLNGRANQLARYLKDKGVVPGQLVGICVERSLDMVVGLLGIIKAAGAYVPLDPNLPKDRLQYMLEDSAIQVVLTQDKLKSTLVQMVSQIVALNSDWNEISRREDEDPVSRPPQSGPQRLAYVIYTSGSTGCPKGVMVEHSGVVNFLQSMQRCLGLRATDRLLAVTTLGFDIAALEILLPLVNGASVIVASRQAASDAGLLIAMLAEFEITVLQATPATWHLLLSGGWSGRSKLKALCGGEALTTDLCKKLLSRAETLWNLYGPTETTIWSCVRQISATSDQRGSVESIGRPISNTQIYILDNRQQPVPIGAVGEIYIGGAGVARGYLNRPELTAKRFLVDPFSGRPRTRMYRSGDLGRWSADGTIEYLGRKDHQVKLRGFRIELGEIESQLTRHEQVKEAVVVAREEVEGEKRLVAYVVCDRKAAVADGTTENQRNEFVSGPETAITNPTTGLNFVNEADATENSPMGRLISRLREYLQERLPDYMVPSAWVVLKQMPLTPNGKVDRRSLPAPRDLSEEMGHYIAPRTELERTLAEIWTEVLRVDQVGVHDNFFELGGHSLLATRVISRIRELLGVELTIRTFFDAPTVQRLSARVEAEMTAEETLWVSTLTQNLRRDIDEMQDDAVLARIATLEEELSPTISESGRRMGE